MPKSPCFFTHHASPITFDELVFFIFRPLQRMIFNMRTRLCFASQWTALATLGVALFAGCGNRDAVQVRLNSRTASGQGTMHLEITAQVAGSQTGLRYKWFAVAGGCSPQESERPSTSFKFADGADRDRVSVEVWRDGKIVGRSQLDVKMDELQARLAEHIPTDVAIAITSVPPYEPQGGPDTRADIAGLVKGNNVSNYSVVLYARASEVWYIQPIAYAALPIRPDNTWTSWTHTGSSYAALLVRPGFEPIPRLDLLPNVGGYVVARDVVEGKR
jgi:hypothetical protein